MSVAAGKEPATSIDPAQFAVIWDREVGRWRVTADGKPITDEAGNQRGWVRFNDAYDAKDAYERETPLKAQAPVSSAPPAAPAVGAWVVDTRTDRTALVAGVLSGRLYLRKPGGGTEWDAMPAHVRLATDHEQLSAQVAEANLRSRSRGVV